MQPSREKEEGEGRHDDPSSTTATTLTLKVLLFNVWQLPGFLTDGASAVRARRAARLIARSGADVICLNEAFLRANEVLEEVNHSHPHRVELGGRASWLTPLGSGIRVASRAPIAASGGRFFRSRAGADRWASKGVLHARLDLRPLLSTAAPTLPLHLDLFVTHMQAGASAAEQASRERQAAELAAFVRERAPPSSRGPPFLLAGDLNMSPCATVSPHCATEEDARCRSRAYGEMCRLAGMQEEEEGGNTGGGRCCPQPAEEICRFCVGGGGGAGGQVRLLRVTSLGRRCPETGEPASDTDALLAEVEVAAVLPARGGGGG